MRKILKDGKKDKLKFNCVLCGEEWLTDEWHSIEIGISLLEGRIFEKRSMCEKCETISIYHE